MFKFRHKLVRNTGVIIGLLKQLIDEIKSQKNQEQEDNQKQKPQNLLPVLPTPELRGLSGSVTVYRNMTGSSSHHRICFSPSLFGINSRGYRYVWFDPQRKCFILTDVEDAGSARIRMDANSPYIDSKKMTLQVFHTMSITAAGSGLTKHKWPAAASIGGSKIFIQA
jgi:hypothetical protein